MAEMSTDLQALSFEDALGELERIVRQLEDGKGKLDDSIAAYERGTELKQHCERKLAEAEAKVSRILPKADGGLGAEPVTID